MAPTTNRQFRRLVAPGVTELHSRRCPRSGDAKKRCTCSPTYKGRVKRRGKEIERSFSALSDAVGWVERTRETLRTGVVAALPRAPAPSFGDAAVSFLHRARLGECLTRSRSRFQPTTLSSYEVTLRRHVLDRVDEPTGLRFADLPIDAIEARTIQRMVDQLSGKKSDATARVAAAVVAAVLRDSYCRGFLDTVPPRVVLPPPPPSRRRTITLSEGDRFLQEAIADDASRGRSLLGPLVALLLATGCRVSEALWVDWGPEGLDLESSPPLVHVQRSKTRAGIRELPLDDRAAAVLLTHLVATSAVEGQPVFCDENGHRLSRHGRVRFGLKRVAAAAGLPGVTPHVLRHARATWLASAGVHSVTAAALLGHADGGALFGRVYAHPGKTDALDAMEAVEKMRRRSAGSPPPVDRRTA
jgi:integrase